MHCNMENINGKCKRTFCEEKDFKSHFSSNLGISETSPLHQYNLDVGDDDVFMVTFTF